MIPQTERDANEPPRRYRMSAKLASRLVIVLAVIAGIVATVGVSAGVFAAVRVFGLAADARDAQVSAFNSRRVNIRNLCVQRETDRADMRQVLRARGLSPEQLPISRVTGRRILAPLAGDRLQNITRACEREAVIKIPERDRP